MTTPVKRTLTFDEDGDPMNELLAWRMGGDSMLKPTPSPGSNWDPNFRGEKVSSPVALDESEQIEREIALLE